MSVGDTLQGLEPLLPIDLFAIEGKVVYGKKRRWLPDTGALMGEESFAKVGLSWTQEAIYASIEIDHPFQEVAFPQFRSGDSVELFFDTRDLKTAGFATRFCHHFVFLPDAVQGIRAQEVTRFRTEDTHPLCDPGLLQLEVDLRSKGYRMEITISHGALHGYDPAAFPRIGFTYRCNRFKREPQHFALSSDFFSIEQQPRLWASMQLMEP